jgi:hypothetical protein
VKRADEAPEPSIEVDVDRKYIVELVGLEEGPSQWPDAKPGDVSLTWKVVLYDQITGEPVIDARDGFTYELWQFSNDNTFRNKKSGRVAKAREWTEAFVGRELTDDEMNELIDFGLREALDKKRALGDLEWTTSKKGYERLKIIRLRPYKKPPKAAAQLPADNGERFDQEGNVVQPAAAETVAQKRKRLGLDDAA